MTPGNGTINKGNIAKLNCKPLYSNAGVFFNASGEKCAFGIREDGYLYSGTGGTATSGSFLGTLCFPIFY